MNSQRPLIRDIAIVLGTSIFLAFTFNIFNSKSIPLVRKEVEKVSVSDSALFSSFPQRKDSASTAGNEGQTPESTKDDHTDVKVIAPEHDRALKNPDSVAATVAGERKQETKKDVFRIITLDQFKRLMAQAKPVIFDDRDAEGYRKGHVKGARNLYGLEADQRFEQLVTIPRDTLIVLYCNNPDCHLGRMAADFLTAIGFTNLYLYDDGWDGWEKAKMPVDSTTVQW
ncbi:MAG: rhodanese-like domain-containing protein [Ignavibacteriae bacterium]|nr:rhodanese-like domain-containing protein [Ignavibacteria bacterium]MBI3364426.1 rhodanese-like domain-containing protein [Ignavibacteriota bacterium]